MYILVIKSYNNFYFELEMPVQSDNTKFQIVYLDLVICLKATCSNILQALFLALEMHPLAAASRSRLFETSYYICVLTVLL